MSKRAAVNTVSGGAGGYRRSRDEAEKVERRLARYPEALVLVEQGRAPALTKSAVELLKSGHHGLEIASKLGVSRSRVYESLNDPTGEKSRARKAKAQRPCVDCGEPCNMDGSRSEPSERCHRCACAKQSAGAKWKPDTVLEAIRRWASEHGSPPMASEWADSFRRHPDFEKGGWPTANTVAYRFGTFNAAVEAAGLQPAHRPGGQPRKPLTPQQLADTAALAQEHGLGGAAKRLGMTVAGVQRRIEQFENKPIRRNKVALTAEDIIERELEKHENKANRLREELDEIEKQRDRLKIAREALQVEEPVAA